MEEKEIDLRPFVQALIRGWPVIVIGGLIAAIIAISLSSIRKTNYMAQSQVAIVRLETQADLGSNITEERLAQTDSTPLRSGLVSFAATGIAPDVVKVLGDQLPTELRNPAVLQGMVEVSARGNTDIIQIQVTADNPEQAKLIADTWSRTFVQRANDVFGKQTQVSDLTEVVAEAQAAYQQREIDVASSPLTIEVSRLGRESNQLNAILTTLRSAQLGVITSTLARQGDQKGVALDAARTSQVQRLTLLYDDVSRLSRLRDEVRAFRDLVQQGSTSGSSFAYGLLKTQLLAGTTGIPTSIQSQVAFNDVPTLTDLDTLLSNTEARLTAIQDQITALTTEFQNGTAYPLSAQGTTSPQQPDEQAQTNLTSLLATLGVAETGTLIEPPEIAKLETRYLDTVRQLQEKQSALFVLSQERDQARDKYLALQKRSTELQAASAGEDSVVRFASESVPMTVVQQVPRNTALAFVIGSIFGVLFLFLRTWLRTMLQEPRPLKPIGERQRAMEQA